MPTRQAQRWGGHSHGGQAHATRRVRRGTDLAKPFLLGLAGGIIPSTNALIILLATIATGRAVYGFVLVVASGWAWPPSSAVWGRGPPATGSSGCRRARASGVSPRWPR